MFRKVVSAVALVAACSSEPPAQKGEMTQRQRDSAVAASRLPGAGGVGRAMQVADSAQARSDLADSIDP